MGTINTTGGGNYTITSFTSYVSDQNNANDTTRKAIAINVAPSAPAGIGSSRCGIGSIILNASGSDTTYWYDSPSGGNLLFVGDSYSIPSLSSSTTFYAQSGNVCNTQPRAAVSATINPLPNVFLGNDTIVGDSIILDAGPGFVQYLWNTSATTQTITVDSSSTIIVAVIDNNGCINSDTIVLTITVGLTESQLEAGIRIYPNPTQDKLNVLTGTSKDALITIIDMQGQILVTDEVKNAANATRTYDVSQFAKGIYFLQITTGTQSSTSKIVVQ
jgi:hypothetical protein